MLINELKKYINKLDDQSLFESKNMANTLIINLNKGFFIILIFILILILVIINNNCNYYYSCNNYLFNSHMYLLLASLLYVFLVICFLELGKHTSIYKIFKYFHDNYYIIWISILSILVLICGLLFEIYENHILYSHLLWLFIIILMSIISTPHYKDLNEINLLINNIINKVIIIIFVMLFIILYKDTFKYYVEDNNYIIISIIIIIIIIYLREKLIKDTAKQSNITKILGYILLLVFTSNIIKQSDYILENPNYCSNILNNVNLENNLYYPNYCKLSIDVLLNIIKVLKNDI